MISLPIETERLRIRPVDPERDAGPLFELWGNAEAMQYVRPPSGSVDEVRERLESLVVWPDGWGLWALEQRDGGRFVGLAGLFPLAMEGPEIELAYHVVPSLWGRGYATEAGGALLDAAWRESELDHVVAIAFEANAASRRVMEKLGFAYEGPARYRDMDVVRYSIQRPVTLR